MKSDLQQPRLSWKRAPWFIAAYLIAAVVGLFVVANWANSQLTGPYYTVTKSSQGVLTDVSGYATNLEVSQVTGAPQSGDTWWSVTGFVVDLRYSQHFLDLSRVTYYSCSAAANTVGVSMFVLDGSYVTEYPMEHSFWWRQNTGATIEAGVSLYAGNGTLWPLEATQNDDQFTVRPESRRGHIHGCMTGMEGPTSGQTLWILRRAPVW